MGGNVNVENVKGCRNPRNAKQMDDKEWHFVRFVIKFCILGLRGKILEVLVS